MQQSVDIWLKLAISARTTTSSPAFLSMEQDLQWSPDKEDQIGVHPNHFNATQKFVEKRNLHINIQRSHKGDDYTTMGRRSELEERQQGGYERKPTDASKGTVHTFEPSQYEPNEAMSHYS